MCYQQACYFKNFDFHMCFLTSSWEELLFYSSKNSLLLNFVQHRSDFQTNSKIFVQHKSDFQTNSKLFENHFKELTMYTSTMHKMNFCRTCETSKKK